MIPLLEIASLSVGYGQGPVLHDVSLRVNSGDVLGLVGESGCGKTTLGLAILGLLPEYAEIRGQILFAGRDLFSMSKAERRALLGERITTVPQSTFAHRRRAHLSARCLGPGRDPQSAPRFAARYRRGLPLYLAQPGCRAL